MEMIDSDDSIPKKSGKKIGSSKKVRKEEVGPLASNQAFGRRLTLARVHARRPEPRLLNGCRASPSGPRPSATGPSSAPLPASTSMSSRSIVSW
jgi:hypothetical protein